MTKEQLKAKLLKELENQNDVWQLKLSPNIIETYVDIWIDLYFKMIKISKIKKLSLYFQHNDNPSIKSFHLYINDTLLLTVF